jgi:uncharacterized protein (DUF1697 family)
MGVLQEAFREMGFPEARTFIASGNVVFDVGGDDLGEIEETIEGGLRDRLGYSVDTFVRTREQVRSLSGAEPLAHLERGPDDRVHVIFLKTPPPRDMLARILEVVPDGDAVTVQGLDVLWLRRGKLSDLKLRGSDPVQAVARVPSTMRNLNTIQRLSAVFFTST